MHTTEELIDLALKEDIGAGDITTDNIIPAELSGIGIIVAKQDLVVAGLQIAEKVFKALEPAAGLADSVKDGDRVGPGATVATFEGSLRTLLKGERTALNFMQRLSGIATQTRAFVQTVSGTPAKLVDTRKTTPGWRVLEKYAVRVGGGGNHRMGLYDGVLIKDNHIAVAGGILQAVKQVRQAISHLVKVEVETTGFEEVREALEAGADIIMLDNMDLDQILQAVKMIDRRALVEVSGGITRDRLRDLARSGVDLISIGALTHSAVAVDLSMRITKT